MRIGVLTFHEIFNPGAFYQTLGTVALLRDLGHEAVVIHYTTPAHRFSAGRVLRNWRLWRHPIMVCELFGRHRAYQEALVQFPLSPRLDMSDSIADLGLDAILIGADVVWDFLTPHLGQDPVYFGAGLEGMPVYAWAASCGTASANADVPGYIQPGLPGLTAITVRDTNTQRFAERMGRSAERIPDPALQLWNRLPDLGRPLDQPYLLVYMSHDFKDTRTIASIRRYAQARGLRIVAVCYRHAWVSDNVITIGPGVWLQYVRHAEAFLTNTFHGTLFAAMTGVPIAIDLRGAVRLKALDAVSDLGLRDQEIGEGGDVESLLARSPSPDVMHDRLSGLVAQGRSALISLLEHPSA